MAKKETKAANTAATLAPAAPKGPAIERGQTDHFTAVFKDGKPVEPTGKLAPQAKTILNGIVAAGKGGLSRAQLVKDLTGILQTRQPVGRIVSYYQKTLVSSGAVTLSKGAETAE